MPIQPHAAAYAIIAFQTADVLGCSASLVQPDSTFIHDLGADSLALVELVMAIEDEFGVDIPDLRAEQIKTPADVVAYLEEVGFDFSSLTTTASPSEQPAEPEPTLQELFDKAVCGVIAQGRPSRTAYGCCYRGEGGAMCAVGQLITDEVYASYTTDSSENHGENNRLEGMSVSIVDVRKALADSLGVELEPRAIDMLGWLQRAHDDTDNPAPIDEPSLMAWRRRFEAKARDVASVYGLSTFAMNEALREQYKKEAVGRVEGTV